MDCDVGLRIGVPKPTTPNPRHDAIYKGDEILRTSSPKMYVK
jgi:hypothetical protein